MSKENKKSIFSLILKLNLILGLYNIYLFCYGQMIFNLFIGSMNIAVWTFCRDKDMMLAILKTIRIKNH